MAMVEEGRELDSVEDSKLIEELGHYAVKQYNVKEGKRLTFTRVVAAKQELIQGARYYLDVEAREGLIHHHHKIYEAEVWQKPGCEEKFLEKFKLKGDDNVGKLTEHNLTVLAVDDPTVVEAAERAVDKLNENKNFVVNYALVEVTSAKAKLIRIPSQKIPTSFLGKIALSFGHTGTMRELYDIDMKIDRGKVQESLKAVVHHSLDGAWIVKKVEIIKSGWTFAF
ncbi:hypothetical protein R1sor_009853 [Riccia sorocarpa]|uniref:Cysteine proteinase inhibitor n=1 Tax=Riccia sorocarpa TaxID=122646 RepID=A0ABD3HW98_9MARC